MPEVGAGNVEIVLLDGMLPGRGVGRAVERLRAKLPAARIAIMAPLSPAALSELAAGAGADAWLATNRGLLHIEGIVRTWLGAEASPASARPPNADR